MHAYVYIYVNKSYVDMLSLKVHITVLNLPFFRMVVGWS